MPITRVPAAEAQSHAKHRHTGGSEIGRATKPASVVVRGEACVSGEARLADVVSGGVEHGVRAAPARPTRAAPHGILVAKVAGNDGARRKHRDTALVQSGGRGPARINLRNHAQHSGAAVHTLERLPTNAKWRWCRRVAPQSLDSCAVPLEETDLRGPRLVIEPRAPVGSQTAPALALARKHDAPGARVEVDAED